MNHEPKVYLTRAGAHGEDEQMSLERNMAIIGFAEVPTLEEATNYEDIRRIVNDKFPGENPNRVNNFARQLRTFVLDIQEGDLIVLPRKLTSQIAIGRVVGPYEHYMLDGTHRHVRPVEWLQTDLPRIVFHQDLLFTLGAFMTVCNVSRNDAARRVVTVAEGKPDPGASMATQESIIEEQPEGLPDLAQIAHDQIVKRIQERFSGHALTDLVNAVLFAEGWASKPSPPGADGGVDILAGRGSLGLDEPWLCVQVKSQSTPADVTAYRALQGTMRTFQAKQGLLVCWGGFNRETLKESKTGHFSVRLWDSNDLVQAIYRTYSKLPKEIQAELPLKQAWMLVMDESEN